MTPSLVRFGTRAALAVVLMLAVLLAPAGHVLEPVTQGAGDAVVATDEVVPVGVRRIKRWKRAERRLMRWINRERTDRGLNELRRRKTLGYLGRKHSRAMRAEGDIFHSDLGSLVRKLSWSLAGENVGVGPTMWSLHKAFMDSPGHRDNVLNERWNRLGVGVVRSGSTEWVTVLFLGS